MYAARRPWSYARAKTQRALNPNAILGHSRLTRVLASPMLAESGGRARPQLAIDAVLRAAVAVHACVITNLHGMYSQYITVVA